MNQTNSAPNSESPKNTRYGLPAGHSALTSAAAPSPTLDTSSAWSGAPRPDTLPSEAGTKPARASENSVRDIRYRLAFALDRAALITTKFITPAAAGMPSLTSTVTNGL